MINAVLIGKAKVNDKVYWKVCIADAKADSIAIKNIEFNEVLSLLNETGTIEDYNIDKDGENIAPKNMNNLHTLGYVDKPAIDYILLSITKRRKIAKVLDIKNNKILSAEVLTVLPQNCKLLRVRLPNYGSENKKNEFAYCDNIWIKSDGNFDDKHYLGVNHLGNGLKDVSDVLYNKVVERNRKFNSEYYGIEIGTTDTLEERTIDKSDETTSSEKPENILNVKETDKTMTEQSESRQIDTDESAEDSEIDKFYDSNGNCIDFIGLSAYLDKKKLDELEKQSKNVTEKFEKPSIEVGISDAFKNVLSENEKHWVCITKNDLYEELVFSMTERGTIDVPSSLLDQVKYKILKTLDGTSFEFKEVGTDSNGVIQYEEVAVTPHYVYLAELYKNNWKKYYLLQANSEYKNRLKLQCLSDWVEKADELDFSIFIKKYLQWIGRKEYLRVSDWS